MLTLISALPGSALGTNDEPLFQILDISSLSVECIKDVNRRGRGQYLNLEGIARVKIPV